MDAQHNPHWDPEVVDSPPLGSLERSEIQKSIDDDKLTLKETLWHMHELQVSIDNLRASLARRMSFISPIHCVPTEILSHIFSFLEPPKLPQDVREITRYMLVCKRWARVISGTPLLLSRFELQGFESWPLPLLTKMMGKFPNHPLNVELVLDHRSSSKSSDFLDLIKLHMRRMVHLSLCVSEHGYASQWTQILPKAIMLETLSLNLYTPRRQAGLSI